MTEKSHTGTASNRGQPLEHVEAQTSRITNRERKYQSSPLSQNNLSQITFTQDEAIGPADLLLKAAAKAEEIGSTKLEVYKAHVERNRQQKNEQMAVSTIEANEGSLYTKSSFSDSSSPSCSIPVLAMPIAPSQPQDMASKAIHKAIQSQAQNQPKAKSPKSSSYVPKGKPLPHVYHDYASVPETVLTKRKKGGVSKPFPEKLYQMLEEEKGGNVLCWCPHGRAFIVLEAKRFMAEVMPKYFRQTKLTSFQRQLNLYGFRRITRGPDAGAYYHELLLRGRPQLCARMIRHKVKGTGHKQPNDVESEPNFYAMPPVTVHNTSQTSCESTVQQSSLLPQHGHFVTRANADNGGRKEQKKSVSSLVMSPGLHAASLLNGMSNTPLSQPMNTIPPLQLGQEITRHPGTSNVQRISSQIPRE